MENNFSRQLSKQFTQSPEKQILHVLINKEYHHITYQTLFTQALKYQKVLAASGLEKEDIVILILPHGIDLIFAYFGCILNGSIPSIMPYLTEKLIPEKYRQDLESLFKITKPAGIITFSAFKQEIQFLQSERSSVKSVTFIEDVELDEMEAEPQISAIPGFEIEPEQIVLLQHSSGTTGLQKGVALSHRAVFNQLESYLASLKVDDGDVIVSWLPLYHDMGLIAAFLMPILTGIPLVLMSPFEWVRAPYLLMQAVTQYKGTLCWLPNFAYNFLATKVRDRDLENVEISSLRAVINCSEPMRKTSHDMFLNRYEPFGFKESALATSYAMAENVFAVTQGGIAQAITYDEVDLKSFQEDKKAINAKVGEQTTIMVSAGRPIDHVMVKIINQEGQSLPDRHIGEIVIQSNCMLTGYYHREDATEQAFIDGWFKTGDYGYLADGELYISGRKKDLIIVGGKNIFPKDIETIVMGVEGIHPGRAVAFGIFNDQKGTEDVIVIAELEDGYTEEKTNIAAQIRARVTQESAIALRNVLLVDRKWLIKTSSGKIARALNKQKYIEMTQDQ